jgi:hypothetical protein
MCFHQQLFVLTKNASSALVIIMNLTKNTVFCYDAALFGILVAVFNQVG